MAALEENVWVRLAHATAELEETLALRSERYGFEYTSDHLTIETAVDHLVAARRPRPRLTLILGGKTAV